jgi:colanic acid/amylovoran biosynthesis glycosyltransferase
LAKKRLSASLWGQEIMSGPIALHKKVKNEIPSSSALPRVIVFSDHLLYPSETFIRAQAYALSDFEPVFAGSRLVPGLDLPMERTHVISRGDYGGRIQEAAFKLFGVAPRLTRQLSALNPVLLHAHHGPNGLRALPIARSLGIPLLVTFHGSDATVSDFRYHKSNFGHRRYNTRKAELQKGSALFLAVSQFVRRKLLEQGFPEEKVEVHYTGVDIKMFQPASTERDPIILFVGRLVERKGAEFLIQAVAEVQKELPAAELVVVGDGPLRADLEQLAKQSLRRYRFLGVLNHAEVGEWMNRASLFCAPSVKIRSGEEEGFGMVYAEAMAMEKPVVAFDSGGISEVVSHGQTGFLAPERDWRTLAEYLSILMQDAGLRKRFGVAGRERVVRTFDLDQRTKVLETIYARVSGIGIAANNAASGVVSRSGLSEMFAKAATAPQGITGRVTTD